ncbi:hypothetical protein Hanom_Chr15g01396061 [Helianthus anomalus]
MQSFYSNLKKLLLLLQIQAVSSISSSEKDNNGINGSRSSDSSSSSLFISGIFHPKWLTYTLSYASIFNSEATNISSSFTNRSVLPLKKGFAASATVFLNSSCFNSGEFLHPFGSFLQ